MEAAEIAAKIGAITIGMEDGQWRYVAAEMPASHVCGYEARREYYATHKGHYRKNIIGKDGKYIDTK